MTKAKSSNFLASSFRFILRWSNRSIALLTISACLAPFVSPLYFWPLAFLGLCFHWLWVSNALLSLLELYLKQGRLVLPLLAILVGLWHIPKFINFNFYNKTQQSDKEIRVMSYNVRMFNTLPLDSEEDQIKEFEKTYPTIKNADLDIFCIQEYPLAHMPIKRYISKKIKADGIPYGFRGNSSNVIFSKYPIINRFHRRFPKSGNSFMYADIEKNGDTIRVFNFHLQSTRLDLINNRPMTAEERQNETLQHKTRRVARKLRLAYWRRADQAKELTEVIKRSPYPTIICGDLNDTPVSYAYRQVSQGVKDTFLHGAKGMGYTYAGKIPLLRIDYVFINDGFKVLKHKIIRESRSDHYANFVVLKLK